VVFIRLLQGFYHAELHSPESQEISSQGVMFKQMTMSAYPKIPVTLTEFSKDDVILFLFIIATMDVVLVMQGEQRPIKMYAYTEDIVMK
jgi:hypothetical protein